MLSDITIPPIAFTSAHAIVGLSLAFLYGVACYRVGKIIVGDQLCHLSSVESIACIAVGAAAFSFVFSILAIANISTVWTVVLLPFVALVAEFVGNRPTRFRILRFARDISFKSLRAKF